MKILIIDDEPHIINDLGDELKFENHEVYKASNVNEAKEIISNEKLDYAIIDLIMLSSVTRYGGLEVLNFLKSNQPNVKFIMISGSKFDDVEDRIDKELKNTFTDRSDYKKIIQEIKCDYIYKGGRNYIESVMEKVGIEIKETNLYGNYYALLIAVQNYNSLGIKNLEHPIADAENLSKILTSNYTFEEKNVKVLQNPDRNTIINELFTYSRKLSSEDNLLIFFAGHGYWNDKLEQGYWLPRDADTDMPSNWISNGEVCDYIRGIKTQHTLLITDACFGGTIFNARDGLACPKTIREKYSIPSRRAITSGDSRQTVPDRSDFLKYLINILKINKIDQVYAEKLYIDVCDNFIYNNKSQQNPVYGVIQDTGDKIGGDFIFVKKY